MKNMQIGILIYYVITTRRFLLYDKELREKAKYLQANNRGGKVHTHHEFNDNILLKDIQNEQFKARGMSNRVDLPITQEPVNLVRMCSIFNEAAKRNEERIETGIYIYFLI